VARPFALVGAFPGRHVAATGPDRHSCKSACVLVLWHEFATARPEGLPTSPAARPSRFMIWGDTRGGELGQLSELGLGLDRARRKQLVEVVGKSEEPGHARNAAAWPRGLGTFAQDERVRRRSHMVGVRSMTRCAGSMRLRQEPNRAAEGQ
jgi:hypothetical protein